MTPDESIKAQLLVRVRHDAPHRDYFVNAIEGAFNIVASLEAERDRINKDNRFSDQGKRESIAALVSDHFAPELARGAAKVARHAGERNESKRIGIGKPTFDKTDLAAAMERQEVRSFIRSIPEGKRFGAAMEMVKDPLLAQAILSGPGSTLGSTLTGLGPDQMGQVLTIYLRTHFTDQLADIEAEKTDIDAVAAASQIAWAKLLEASSKSLNEFNKFWAELEGLADAA